ncbi:NYN domain-containing protein [Sphaerisporangium sp. NPDC049003]|uniref:NYN domain-containing protein n=1 Tax=Sphaerisporangium sp. NPDC049003 TaxID=3364517 RepID=UPI00371A23B8
MTDKQLRLAVFYDGGWFIHLWGFLADHSKWRAKPAFAGIHDVMRWYLHRELGLPLTQITMDEAHYVLGRPTDSAYREADASGPFRSMSRGWDELFRNEGIVRHEVLVSDYSGNREAGADVELALLVYERAIAGSLDAVVLITGDADFLPLVHRLRTLGIRVILPSSFTEADGGNHKVRSAPLLIEAADHTPSWESLLDSGLAPEYRLRYPFIEPVKGATTKRADDGYSYGTVNKWKPGAAFGFITDTQGTSWFVERQALPPGLKSLPVGQQVRFNGRPHPAPGRPYPQAYAVQPVTVG